MKDIGQFGFAALILIAILGALDFFSRISAAGLVVAVVFCAALWVLGFVVKDFPQHGPP